jgi:hypothetical protein
MEAEKRNRANDKDRPRTPGLLREVPMNSPAGKKCKEAGGHDHIFQRFDRYGCCTRCGDEVLT